MSGKIGIDPGHGGGDPGAVSKVRPELGDKIYLEEADVTLDVALEVERLLKASGHQVVMTRTKDVNVSLIQRSNMLNKANCDIAVSIHVNSTTSHQPNYLATFIQGTGGEAEKLARKIHTQLVKVTGWKDNGLVVKNLHMTRETKMPACLLELGFISNPSQEAQLANTAFRKMLAQAIVKGINDYLGKGEMPVTWKEKIIQEALTAGLINEKHDPDEMAPKWFVLATMLNMLKKMKE
jgi:N-acetylmuramoyl-L-alanine amidase